MGFDTIKIYFSIGVINSFGTVDPYTHQNSSNFLIPPLEEINFPIQNKKTRKTAILIQLLDLNLQKCKKS